jgi:hypothetical protein
MHTQKGCVCSFWRTDLGKTPRFQTVYSELDEGELDEGDPDVAGTI